jgi:hypothetical protein
MKTKFGLMTLLSVWALAGCSEDHDPGTFEYRSATDDVEIRYAPGPPQHVYDSALIEVALKPKQAPATDSLALELLPARGGWTMPSDSFFVRDAEGWYRAHVWIRPTETGEFVLRWQTAPFTGFTFHMVAHYDITGQLTDWGNLPGEAPVLSTLVLRDTMEVVYSYWPHVWYRRIHLVRRPDSARTYYIITQSLHRRAGVSGREIWPTANLSFDSAYALRTRRWDSVGWVVDTLCVTVRDTLVASIDWSYKEFVDNWEKNYSLFRNWEHERSPDLYFQLDTGGHIRNVWKQKPADRYIAAKLHKIVSLPDYDSLHSAFISEPVAAASPPDTLP